MKEHGRKEGGGDMGYIPKIMGRSLYFKSRARSPLRRRKTRRTTNPRFRKSYMFKVNHKSFNNQLFRNLLSKSLHIIHTNTKRKQAFKSTGVTEVHLNRLRNQRIFIPSQQLKFLAVRLRHSINLSPLNIPSVSKNVR